MSNRILSYWLALAALAFSVQSSSSAIIEFKSIRADLESGINKFFPDGHRENDIRQASIDSFGAWFGNDYSVETRVPETVWQIPDYGFPDELEKASPYAYLDFTFFGNSLFFEALTDAEILSDPDDFDKDMLDGPYNATTYAFVEFQMVFKVVGGDTLYNGRATALEGVDTAGDCVHKVINVSTKAEVLNVGDATCYDKSEEILLKAGNTYKLTTRIANFTRGDEENYNDGSFYPVEGGMLAYGVPEPELRFLPVLALALFGLSRRGKK